MGEGRKSVCLCVYACVSMWVEVCVGRWLGDRGEGVVR